MAVGVDVHGAHVESLQAGTAYPHGTSHGFDGAPNRACQIVWVGFEEEIEVPRTSSILSFSTRVLSSLGKRTPTPCVRPAEALGGVIHATLPATGYRCASSGSDNNR